MAVRSVEKKKRTTAMAKPSTRSTAPPVILAEVPIYPFPPPTTPLAIPLAAIRTPRKRLLKRWRASMAEEPHQQLMKRLKYAEERLECFVEQGNTKKQIGKEKEMQHTTNDESKSNESRTHESAYCADEIANELKSEESNNEHNNQRNVTTQRLQEIRVRLHALRGAGQVNRKA